MNHGDHGGHEMGPKCSTHMLWNTQIVDTCIVFPQWHIKSGFSFFISFLVVVALGFLYEYLREVQKSLDVKIASSLASRLKGRGRTPGSGRSTPDHLVEETSLLSGKKPSVGPPIPLVYRALRGILYGAAVFLSFFLMLVFMTYNAYLILAVVLGAVLGHIWFGRCMDIDAVLAGAGPAGRSMACH